MLFGLVLLAIEQWSFRRLNPEGVTLEFVEMVTKGRGMEAGTLAKFRLRNNSGRNITYYGKSAQEPQCNVASLGRDHSVEGGPVFVYPYVLRSTVGLVGLWSEFTVKNGEEVIVYARVGHAEEPWQALMSYRHRVDDRDWRLKYVPQRFHAWLSIPLVLHPSAAEVGQVVASDAVNIKVRGLTNKQRLVLEDYRWFLNKAVANRIQTTIVTNVDGSFELKQVRVKQSGRVVKETGEK